MVVLLGTCKRRDTAGIVHLQNLRRVAGAYIDRGKLISNRCVAIFKKLADRGGHSRKTGGAPAWFQLTSCLVPNHLTVSRKIGCVMFIRLGILLMFFAALTAAAQTHPQEQSSYSKSKKSSSARLTSDIGAGTVVSGVYRNRALGLSCKVPAGWVLRTEEMNAREEGTDSSHGSTTKSSAQATQGNPGEGGRVLLAAFSRPPDARGEDVNASIVIAAEKVGTYPGLRDAAQYFGPLTEVARAQGFTVDEEPYEIQVGTKVLVRGDFHKDVGTRVMRQSTLAFLAQGYAVSITVIGGTEDEVEELVDGIGFAAAGK